MAGFLIVAWLLATNHCALGLMKPAEQAQAAHAHCHRAQGDSGKDAPAGDVLECCKAIHAAPAPAKVAVQFEATKFELQVFALIRIFSADDGAGEASGFFDHRPPRVISFAESVLQRSLLGHAPPLAV